MSDTPDISKIIGLIMENPELMNQIASLMKKDTEAAPPEPQEEAAEQVSAPVSLLPENRGIVPPRRRPERTQLLHAMKPYLRESRGKAIDTMVSILDILDVMGGR